MKLRGCAAGAFMVVVGIVVACSSHPSQPPIDTGGPTKPVGGGGGSAPNGDAGTEDSGGVIVAPDAGADAGNPCLLGTCVGCCTALNVCESGSQSGACGINSLRCTACPGTTMCIAGNCE